MSDTPRVAHLLINLEHGGLERCVLYWSEERNRREPQSTLIICLDQPGVLAESLESTSWLCLNADRSRFPWDTDAVRKLRKILHEEHIDIVHSHNTAARFYAALAARKLPIRHLYTDHGSNRYLGGVSGWLRQRMMNRHTDRLTAVSRVAAKTLQDSGKGSIPDVRVIANGISPTSMGLHKCRYMLDIPGDAFVIGYAGRLSPEKGVLRLIRCFAGIAESCHLVLLGDGPEYAACRALGASLALGERMHMPGAVANARDYMAAFDLFVLPSFSEGLSLALLEAMAEGVPVAATAVGESPEVLAHGRYGVLLPDDEAQWGPIIQTEITSIKQGERRTQCHMAQRQIAQHYSLSATVDQYEACYRELWRV